MSVLRKHVASLVLAACTLALGACATPAPPSTAFLPITFDDGAPIRLNVSEIAVEQAYAPPGVPPNVDHLFPVPPLQPALRWASDRLRAEGAGFRVEYVVRDASVVEVDLKTSTGLTAVFTKDQAQRYDGRVEVEIRIVDSMGRIVGKAQAEAVRSRSVAEDITLNDRDKVWHAMTQDLMREIDGQLKETIRTVFQPYVIQ